MLLTRRSFLSSTTGAAALSYPCYFEPRWFEVTQRTVKLGTASAGRPLRLLHLSDLHASLPVPVRMIDGAVSVALDQHPDVICLTGDFITHRASFEIGDYVRTLRRLSAAAPTYAVLGNHDGGLWAETLGGYSDHRLVETILADSGIALLHNRAVAVDVAGRRLSLAGVADLWSLEIDAARAFAGIDRSHPIVLLAHNPDSKDVLGTYPWDLMLSGHTHGGQVGIPFAGSYLAPVEDKRYVEGLKPWGSRQVHVTRGIGNIAGVRFACRPEISLLMIQ